jgi:hypothetical protein
MLIFVAKSVVSACLRLQKLLTCELSAKVARVSILRSMSYYALMDIAIDGGIVETMRM